jgi:hypothetical protein
VQMYRSPFTSARDNFYEASVLGALCVVSVLRTTSGEGARAALPIAAQVSLSSSVLLHTPDLVLLCVCFLPCKIVISLLLFGAALWYAILKIYERCVLGESGRTTPRANVVSVNMSSINNDPSTEHDRTSLAVPYNILSDK